MHRTITASLTIARVTGADACGLLAGAAAGADTVVLVHGTRSHEVRAVALVGQLVSVLPVPAVRDGPVAVEAVAGAEAREAGALARRVVAVASARALRQAAGPNRGVNGLSEPRVNAFGANQDV